MRRCGEYEVKSANCWSAAFIAALSCQQAPAAGHQGVSRGQDSVYVEMVMVRDDDEAVLVMMLSMVS